MVKHAKQWVGVLAALLALLLLWPLGLASADDIDQTIHSIDVEATLHDDGSATITEDWHLTVYGGTEIYKPLELADEDQQTLSDYTVELDGEPLTYVDDWNVDDDFETKAGTYGRNGRELNWGITDYGEHHYRVQYTIAPFVMQTATEQMIFWQFINRDLAVPPEHIAIRVHSEAGELSPDADYRVWAFGFAGTVQFEDGDIVAESDGPLTDESGHGTLLLRIPDGAFPDTLVVDGTFEDYAESAFEGSPYTLGDYYEENASPDGGAMPETLLDKVFHWLGIALIVVVVLIGGGVVLLVLWGLVDEARVKRAGRKYYPPLKKRAKQQAGFYVRERPQADIFEAYHLLGALRVDDLLKNYINVSFLLLIRDGWLSITHDADEEPLLVVKQGADFPREDVREPIWRIVKAAADDEDSDRLTAKEFKHYLTWPHEEETNTAIVVYQDKLDQTSKAALKANGWRGSTKDLQDEQLARAQQDIPVPLSESGRELLTNWVGYYNYMKDFSLLNERRPDEVLLWDNLLIDAAALGIAEEVAKQMQALWPGYVTESALLGADYAAADLFIWSGTLYQYRARHIVSEMSGGAGGFGGSSSVGGGGGSFGGGSGGGAR